MMMAERQTEYLAKESVCSNLTQHRYAGLIFLIHARYNI